MVMQIASSGRTWKEGILISLHVFVVQNGWPELSALVLPGWQEYCERWGYTLHIEQGILPKYADVHLSFSKTAQVLAYYKEHMPEAMWVCDLDMMITNHRIPAGNFPSAKHAITITKDVNGTNSGSYFLNGFWTTKCELWLRSILSLRRQTTSEQHAMWLLEEAYLEDTFFYPHPSFNSIPYDEYPDYKGKFIGHEGNWMPGHLLCHLPGMNEADRVRIFKNYEPLIVR